MMSTKLQRHRKHGISLFASSQQALLHTAIQIMWFAQVQSTVLLEPLNIESSVALYSMTLSCDGVGAFVYDVEEDKLNEAGVRAAVWDEMTFYHPEALNMKRL